MSGHKILFKAAAVSVRWLCQYLAGFLPQCQPVSLPVDPAIDTARNPLEVASISQCVQSFVAQNQAADRPGVLRLLAQLGVIDHLHTQGFTARRIVRPPGDLNQPRPRYLKPSPATAMRKSARPSYLTGPMLAPRSRIRNPTEIGIIDGD